MRISDAQLTEIKHLWREYCRPEKPWRYLDEPLESLLDALFRQYSDSFVLARFFSIVPYLHLTPRRRTLARCFADAKGAGDSLTDASPILSLVATRGAQDDWNRVHRSHGHLAIPLHHPELIGSLPMVSRLLSELGQSITGIPDAGPRLESQMIGNNNGVFFIREAGADRDALGRHIIPAQDFVSAYGVRSVFAVGGKITDDFVIVLIVFCREMVRIESARLLLPLINLFHARILERNQPFELFSPDPAEPSSDTPSSKCSSPS